MQPNIEARLTMSQLPSLSSRLIAFSSSSSSSTAIANDEAIRRLRELAAAAPRARCPRPTSSSARARARSTRARVVLVVGGVEGFRGGFRLRAELPRRPSPRRFRVVVPGLHLRLPHLPRVLISAIEQRRVRRVVSRPRSPPTHRRLGPLLPEDARHGRGLGR